MANRNLFDRCLIGATFKHLFFTKSSIYQWIDLLKLFDWYLIYLLISSLFRKVIVNIESIFVFYISFVVKNSSRPSQ